MAVAIAPRTYADALVKQKVAVGGTKAARDAVVETIRELMAAATNKPATPDVAKTVPHSGTAANASADIKKLYGSQAAGSISVTILGEDHSSAKDTALEKFDNFSKLHTNWIQKRPRTLFLIDSFVKS